jgi:hypothetical protein
MTTLDELKAEHKKLGERIAALEAPVAKPAGRPVRKPVFGLSSLTMNVPTASRRTMK